MIVFEALPAKHGDCLLLRYQDEGEDCLWIIDGGPKGVYQVSLKPRLDELRGNADSLRVNLAMVSHIDDDHIAGMAQLAGKLREAKDAHQTPFLDIRRFWFNSFSKLVGPMPPVAQQLASLAATNQAALLAALPGLEHTAAAVLASVKQGDALSADIVSLQLPLNEGSSQPLTTAQQPISVAGATVTILGPLQPRLEALRQEWAARAAVATGPADLAGLFAENLDESVPNLSSIVALVEIAGKRILLTGDARGDDIVTGWEAVKGSLDPVEIDILKMPHHGSDRNPTEKFVRLFPARHYVISADGRHGNPDRKTLHDMVEILGNRTYTIHVTGPMLDFDTDRDHPQATQRVEQQLTALQAGRNFDFFVGSPVSIAL